VVYSSPPHDDAGQTKNKNKCSSDSVKELARFPCEEAEVKVNNPDYPGMRRVDRSGNLTCLRIDKHVQELRTPMDEDFEVVTPRVWRICRSHLIIRPAFLHFIDDSWKIDRRFDCASHRCTPKLGVRCTFQL